MGSLGVRYGLQKISYQQIKIQVFPTFLEKKKKKGEVLATEGLQSYMATIFYCLLWGLHVATPSSLPSSLNEAACLDHGAF